MMKGFRQFGDAKRYGDPIDLHGKQHLHIYPVIQCQLDCYFCQNKYYTDKLPKLKITDGATWAKYLNRFYNVHHLDINGGEGMLHPDIVTILNSLTNFNIVFFTNLPRTRLHAFKEIKPGRNNIMFCVSYHPLEEERRGRDISQFIDDFKQIPKRLNPTVHVIDIPEVSYKNIRTAFAKRGIFIQALDAIVPTKYNKIRDKFRSVKCRSDMDCIAPDLNVYPCTGRMLRQISPVHIDDYKFNNDFINCDYYGLCGPCTSQKDVREL